MKGEFVFIINGNIETFDNYEKIPKVFQHLIKFAPDFPPPPHTEEQHQEMDQWNSRLTELINREKELNGY
jgi:hypothetical protein